MLTYYYVGLGVIWGLVAILIVPLSDFGSGYLPLPDIVGTALTSLAVLAVGGVAQRRWHRRWAEKLPETVGPQHGSMP